MPCKADDYQKAKAAWMNNDILERIKQKDSLLKRTKTTNKPDDWKKARKNVYNFQDP